MKINDFDKDLGAFQMIPECLYSVSLCDIDTDENRYLISDRLFQMVRNRVFSVIPALYYTFVRDRYQIEN